MLQNITTLNVFFIMMLFFVLGAFGSLLFKKREELANLWGSSFSALGSLMGIVLSVAVLFLDQTFSYSLPSTIPLLTFSFTVDQLSAFFILIISTISLVASIYGIGYIKHYYKKYSISALIFFYNLFILGMIMVVSANNALFFLLVWEIMSLSSYFLVIFENKEKENIQAGTMYFIMTHVGTIFITLAFFFLYKYTGSFDFETIKNSISNVPALARNTVFFFALIGFGTKAGMIPFHIWLPKAHPAAPSHVSALMSGVMIKTAIYMFIRIFMDIMPQVPLWWGFIFLIIGSICAILGILYALAQSDIKKILAYSSIENIGIIFLGIGSSLVFWSLGYDDLATLALIASLFHTLNHSIFKSLLFMGAGSIVSQTHTRNIEKYGGLVKYMPQTAFFFLIGSMAISALPPFNGFASEWMIFQSLFAGIRGFDTSVQWVFMLATSALAFTGGLALTCFVKAFGSIFLARPRSEAVTHAKESGTALNFGMGVLAILALLIGVFAPVIVKMISKVVESVGAFGGANSLEITNSHLTLNDGFATVSAPLFFAVLTLVLIATIFVVNLFTRKRTVTYSRTWDCGVDLKPRMEITPMGFSRSLVVIFENLLKPIRKSSVEYKDENLKYFEKTNTVEFSITDIYQAYMYNPVKDIFIKGSQYVKKIQTGNANVYVSYILLILLLLLLFFVI